MKFPEEFRSPHPLGFPHMKGDNFGWFTFKYNGKLFQAQADALTDWEHVSVSSKTIPSWDEMCYVKSLFWDNEESVIQVHPKKSEYVNLAKTCLHLWRYKKDMPMPPKNAVG
jgi:hypothetical protein